MTKIKLEIETDSEKELASATINFKYSNGELKVHDIVTSDSTVKDEPKIPRKSKKSNSKSNSNDIYEDLRNLPPPEEGVDESFSEKY